MIFIDFNSPPPPKTTPKWSFKINAKNGKVGFRLKTIFLAKERANGSPEAVQILFSKIHKYMSPPTTSFLHPKHAGEKLLGGGSACKLPEKKPQLTFFSVQGTLGP